MVQNACSVRRLPLQPSEFPSTLTTINQSISSSAQLSLHFSFRQTARKSMQVVTIIACLLMDHSIALQCPYNRQPRLRCRRCSQAKDNCQHRDRHLMSRRCRIPVLVAVARQKSSQSPNDDCASHGETLQVCRQCGRTSVHREQDIRWSELTVMTSRTNGVMQAIQSGRLEVEEDTRTFCVSLWRRWSDHFPSSADGGVCVAIPFQSRWNQSLSKKIRYSGNSLLDSMSEQAIKTSEMTSSLLWSDKYI